MPETPQPQEPGSGSPNLLNLQQHPPSFYCPISQQCMHDPVVLSDGHSYERRHIERWLLGNCTSPVTGADLATSDLFTNHALRNAIEEYFQQVFSIHRNAIRRSIGQEPCNGFLGSHEPLLRTIDALMQCSLLVNADLSTENVLRHIMQEAKALVGAEAGSAFLVDRSKGELFSTVNSTGSELRIPLAVGVAGHVASTGESLIVADAYADDRFDPSVDRKTGFVTGNLMCVPLSVRKGHIIGVVQLINKTASGVLYRGTEGANDCVGTPSSGNCGAKTSSSSSSSSKIKQSDEGGASQPKQVQRSRSRPSFTTEDLHFLQVFASQAANAIAHSVDLDQQLHQQQEKQQQEQLLQEKERAKEPKDTEDVPDVFRASTRRTYVKDKSLLVEEVLSEDDDLIAEQREPLSEVLPRQLQKRETQSQSAEQRHSPVPPSPGRSSRHRMSHKSSPSEDQQMSQVLSSPTAGGSEVSADTAVVPENPRRHGRRLPGIPKNSMAGPVARAALQFEAMTEAAASWNFDVMAFEDLTENRPLSRFFHFLCDRRDLIGSISFKHDKLLHWIREVESGYHVGNPYHNRGHATAVLHAMHASLELGGIVTLAHCGEPELDLEEMRLACWTAAAVHDLDHLGLTNDFLVRTGHERAVLYNDCHVNEHHHVAQAFALMRRKSNDFLSGALSAKARQRFRRLTIEMVLATDMADHGRIIQSAQELLASRNGEAFSPQTPEEMSQLLQLTMKSADLGHLTMEWTHHTSWVSRLEQEFFAQGDREISLGLPASFLMDRSKPGPSKTQVGFYDYVVLPLLRTFVLGAPGMQQLLDGALENQEKWRQLDEAAKAEKEEDEEEEEEPAEE